MNVDPSAIALSVDERFHQLEQRITDTQTALQTQTEQIAEVLKLLMQPTPRDAQTTPAERTDKADVPDPLACFVSRRSMLKNAVLATLGAAAVLDTMPSAKAADGDSLILGTANSATSETTVSSAYNGATLAGVNTTSGGLGVSGTAASGNGVAGLSTSGSGVYASSSTGAGVQALSSSGTGVSGSSGSGIGVEGTSTSGIGVYANSSSGYGIKATTLTGPAAVNATSSATYGIGILASGPYSGLYAFAGDSTGAPSTSQSGYGVYAQGSKYGGFLTGSLAPLYLAPNERSVTNPNSDSNPHRFGEVFVDSTSGLWFCAVAGTPGTWRKLADSGTAGSFALLSAPTRFIDTRPSSSSYTTGVTAPSPGGGVTTYIFSGTNALAPYSSGGTPPSIPYGATSLVGRITILNGENGRSTVSGILKVSNANPPGFGSGLVQWKTTPAVQVAPFVLALDNTTVAGSGQMYFVNSSLHDVIDILVDVTGYYY